MAFIYALKEEKTSIISYFYNYNLCKIVKKDTLNGTNNQYCTNKNQYYDS